MFGIIVQFIHMTEDDERWMSETRRMKSLQKFASVHANAANHFNQERHLVSRQLCKSRRSATLAEWQTLMA